MKRGFVRSDWMFWFQSAADRSRRSGRRARRRNLMKSFAAGLIAVTLAGTTVSALADDSAHSTMPPVTSYVESTSSRVGVD